MSTFSGLLYESFRRINGWLLGIASIAISFALFHFTPDMKVSIGWFVVVILTLSVIVFILIDAARQAWKLSRRGLAAVRRAIPPPTFYQGTECVLLAENSELYSVESLVSIFVKDDEYERLFAIGKVLTVQTNGILQIGITSLAESDSELMQQLLANDAGVLKKILVKPSVNSIHLQRN
tara:strand:- start:2221 stop:2757 length:537 start_codon:yes stop_codon:yes gene_type:complete